MKQVTLFELQEVLSRLILNSKKTEYNTMFNYFLIKNKQLVDSEVQILREVRKFPSKWDEYVEKFKSLLQEYAQKGIDGNFIFLPDGSPVLKDTIQAKIFDEKNKRLSEEYIDTLEQEKINRQEWLEVMQNISEVNFYKIQLKNIPDSISAIDLQYLIELIDEH